MTRLRLWHVVILSMVYWWGMGRLLESPPEQVREPVRDAVTLRKDMEMAAISVPVEAPGTWGRHFWVMLLPPVALLIVWRAVGRERGRPGA